MCWSPKKPLDQSRSQKIYSFIPAILYTQRTTIQNRFSVLNIVLDQLYLTPLHIVNLVARRSLLFEAIISRSSTMTAQQGCCGRDFPSSDISSLRISCTDETYDTWMRFRTCISQSTQQLGRSSSFRYREEHLVGSSTFLSSSELMIWWQNSGKSASSWDAWQKMVTATHQQASDAHEWQRKELAQE
jgi:hypothetical protein